MECFFFKKNIIWGMLVPRRVSFHASGNWLYDNKKKLLLRNTLQIELKNTKAIYLIEMIHIPSLTQKTFSFYLKCV